MMTSDERRVVAARLRRDVGESSCIDYAVFRIAHEVLGIEHVTGAKAAHMLAELSDPTCKPVGMNYLGNAPWHDGGVNLDASTTGCSVCGYPFGNGRYYIPGRPNTIPRYCPNCGSRVVMPAEERDAS